MDYGVVITMSAIGAAPLYTGGPFVSGVARLSSAPASTFDHTRLQMCSEVEKVANLQEGGALTSVSRATIRIVLTKLEWQDMKSSSANVVGAKVQIGRIATGSSTLTVFSTMRVVDKSWSGSVLELKLESMSAALADTKIPARTYDDVKYPLIRQSDIGFAGPVVYGHADEVRAIGVVWDDEKIFLPLAVMGRSLRCEDVVVEEQSTPDVGLEILTPVNYAKVTGVTTSGTPLRSRIEVQVGIFNAGALTAATQLSPTFAKMITYTPLTGVFTLVTGDNAGLNITPLGKGIYYEYEGPNRQVYKITIEANEEVAPLVSVGDFIAYSESSAVIKVSENPYSKVRRLPYVERDNAFKDLGGWVRAVDGTLTRSVGSGETGADALSRWRRVEVTKVEWSIDGEEASDIFDYDFTSRQWDDPLAPNYGFVGVTLNRRFGAVQRSHWQTLTFRAHLDRESVGTGAGSMRTFLQSSGGEAFSSTLPVGTPGVVITHRVCAYDGTVLGTYSRSPGFWESSSGDFDEGGSPDVMATGPYGYGSFQESGTRIAEISELGAVGYIEVELRFLVEIFPPPGTGYPATATINIFDLCAGILVDGASTLPGEIGRSVVHVDLDGTTAPVDITPDEHLSAGGLILDAPRVAADILRRHGGVSAQVSGGVYVGGVKDACTDLMNMAAATTTEGVAAKVALVEQTTVAKVVNDIASDFGLVIAESATGDYYSFRAFLARMGEPEYDFEVLPTEILESPAATLQTTSVRDLVNEPVFKFDLTYASGYRQVAKVVGVDADPESITPENIVDYSVGLPNPLNVFAWDVGSLSYRTNGVKRTKEIELRTVTPASIQAALGGYTGTSRLEYLASVLEVQVLAVADSHACFNAVPGDRVRYASREHTDDAQTLATVMAVKFLPETGAVKLALILDPARFDQQDVNYVDSLGVTYPTIVDTLNNTLDNGVDTLEV